MGAITLQNRQSLSRRIHSFGGMNGRGNNRRIRFGDISLMRRDVEVALSSPPNGQGGAMQNGALLQSLRWDVAYAEDQAWARDAYRRLNNWTLDPEYEPTIEDWMRNRGLTPGTVPVTTPVTTPVVTPVTTPGMTDAEYRAALAEAQIEAARLAAVAEANRAATASEAARLAAEDELARVQAEQAAAAPGDEKKSNLGPLLLAAGLAFLVLKG